MLSSLIFFKLSSVFHDAFDSVRVFFLLLVYNAFSGEKWIPDVFQ